MSTHYWHTCGTQSDGTAWCWGRQGRGELGDGSGEPSLVPVLVAGGATNWTSVTTGSWFSCGSRVDGTVWCWGANSDGQLGNGTRTMSPTPTQVGSDADWESVDTGDSFACGTKVGGELFCWGNNQYGQLGDGTTTRRRSPVQVGSDADWASTGLGAISTCAVRDSGALWCWGANSDGQLGDGTTVARPDPEQIGMNMTWTSVAMSPWAHGCGTRIDGSGWCWGENHYGQLGDGTQHKRLNPTRIASV